MKTQLLFRVSGAIEVKMALHSRPLLAAALWPWKLSYAPCQQVFFFWTPFLLRSIPSVLIFLKDSPIRIYERVWRHKERRLSSGVLAEVFRVGKWATIGQNEVLCACKWEGSALLVNVKSIRAPVEKHKHTRRCFTNRSAGLKWKASSFPRFPPPTSFAQPLCPLVFFLSVG